jgi:uncharacterized protein DUF3108
MTNPRYLKAPFRFAPPAAAAWHRILGAVLAGAVLFVSPAPGADSDDDSGLINDVRRPTHPETLPALPSAVRPGESLKFAVNYGFINAGAAYLEVSDVKEYHGRAVLNLVARAESNRFFSGIYKVRNRIESVWDSAGHYSLRYAESRREGKHRAQNEILFDYANQEARYQDGATFPIPPEVQDALSSFYYTRTQALPLGGSVYFDYHASRKSVPLEVKVLGREEVETPAGKFNCVVIEPILKAGGIFKNSGRLVIWLTDDNRRMPVLMKSKVAVGSISAALVQVKPGA